MLSRVEINYGFYFSLFGGLLSIERNMMNMCVISGKEAQTNLRHSKEPNNGGIAFPETVLPWAGMCHSLSPTAEQILNICSGI